MNLLEHFVLHHVQISELSAELVRASNEPGTREAKVELNLTPRPMQADSGNSLPAYQVSARLSCQGGGEGQTGPSFKARVGFEAIYQQTNGEPIDIAQFTANHASLTRQLYPLLQHDLRGLLLKLGLEQIHLPFDLTARTKEGSGQTVQLSSSLH
ncbi:MAG: hypothetical protein ACREO9_02310 [Lysobacterales bacterium]